MSKPTPHPYRGSVPNPPAPPPSNTRKALFILLSTLGALVGIVLVPAAIYHAAIWLDMASRDSAAPLAFFGGCAFVGGWVWASVTYVT